MIRCRGFNERRRQLAVDGLLKTAMVKDILDVKLLNRPRPRGDDAKNNADHDWFDNRVECHVIVHDVLLVETTNDPASLMASERPVGVVLMLVVPLASDDIGARRPRNEATGPVIDEGPILIGHGCTPLQVSQSTAVVGG
jgi:hypothetical protein